MSCVVQPLRRGYSTTNAGVPALSQLASQVVPLVVWLPIATTTETYREVEGHTVWPWRPQTGACTRRRCSPCVGRARSRACPQSVPLACIVVVAAAPTSAVAVAVFINSLKCRRQRLLLPSHFGGSRRRRSIWACFCLFATPLRHLLRQTVGTVLSMHHQWWTASRRCLPTR